MIKVLLSDEVSRLLNNPIDYRGLYVAFEDLNVVAIDNDAYEVMIENFKDLDSAIIWLRNETKRENKKYKVKVDKKESTRFFTKKEAKRLASKLRILQNCKIEIMEVNYE